MSDALVCDDLMHIPECDCGARPDYEYERRVENQ